METIVANYTNIILDEQSINDIYTTINNDKCFSKFITLNNKTPKNFEVFNPSSLPNFQIIIKKIENIIGIKSNGCVLIKFYKNTALGPHIDKIDYRKTVLSFWFPIKNSNQAETFFYDESNTQKAKVIYKNNFCGIFLNTQSLHDVKPNNIASRITFQLMFGETLDQIISLIDNKYLQESVKI